uniref:Uncharacterized protein n=1 Tax=Anopheles culicifacies TaxID=139723 RepID=A0A182MT15_9DIPT
MLLDCAASRLIYCQRNGLVLLLLHSVLIVHYLLHGGLLWLLLLLQLLWFLRLYKLSCALILQYHLGRLMMGKYVLWRLLYRSRPRSLLCLTHMNNPTTEHTGYWNGRVGGTTGSCGIGGGYATNPTFDEAAAAVLPPPPPPLPPPLF